VQAEPPNCRGIVAQIWQQRERERDSNSAIEFIRMEGAAAGREGSRMKRGTADGGKALLIDRRTTSERY
jgi:hypothetical protein